MCNPALHHSAKRALIALLLLLQIGFVSGETLLMTLAEVEHHALISPEVGSEVHFEASVILQADTASHDTSTHHCDICHGHSVHFALTADKDLADMPFLAIQQTLPSVSYYSLNLGAIYRPPILAA